MEQRADRERVVRGGVVGHPDADLLVRLAGDPRLRLHGGELIALAAAVRTGRGLADWGSVDVLATFARPDLIVADRPARRTGWLGVAQSVVVLVPIMITWIGLVAATGAYDRLLASADAGARIGSQSFLQLWQQGFDGELAEPLRFAWIGAYTVIALVVIAAITLASAVQMRRAERESVRGLESLLAELVPALLRTQRLVGAAVLSSPARFAAELSRTAAGLADLVARTTELQTGIRGHSAHAERLTGRMTTAADHLVAVTAGLRDSATASAAAAATLQAAGRAIDDALAGHVAAARAEITQASERGAAAIESVAARHRESTEHAIGRMESAAELLRVSCDALTDAGPQLAEALSAAGRSGAESIAQTYELAVAGAATTLSDEMTAVGHSLAAHIEQLEAMVNGLAAIGRQAVDGHAARLEAVARSTDALTGALDTMSTDLNAGRPAARGGSVQARHLGQRRHDLPQRRRRQR